MALLSNLFGFVNKIHSSNPELPDIFPFPFGKDDFIFTDVQAIFSKILTDVLERTHGLDDEQTALMWDSCVKSSSQDGVISMLAKAMSNQEELFLVIDAGVVRKADSNETVKIRDDYANKAGSEVGVYISFKNFNRARMVKLYVALEYYTVRGLYKNLNLSSAIQFKVGDLRKSVGAIDSEIVIKQAKAVAKGMGDGKDALIDAADAIEMLKPDLTAVNESITFTSNKIGFYLGYPAAYITSIQTAGMNATGETDARAIDRGHRSYFAQVLKPTLEALFDDVELTYKSIDTRQIQTAVTLLKDLSLTDETLISIEDKRRLVAEAFGLDQEDDESDLDEPQPELPLPTSRGGNA